MLDGKAWVEKEIQLSAAAIATSPFCPGGRLLDCLSCILVMRRKRHKH
ncbi:hypothetical protein PLANPX_3481 [Lacipirellula parvula]|uniref:Uncharacterized protein n=1 Tax=Lacipirellula parvula TaxID=2650471 RepID=A0A5K7XLQ7_9BACT|nr:hypothetical protein PLANPX_3481 [Lacipirellula parvula]